MESASRSDWALLAAVAAGDADAFRGIVETHQERIVRLCERLLGDRDDALETAQEVFLRTYRKAATLESRGRLYTWLYRVAVNLCLNRLRRRKLVRFFSLEGSRDDEAPIEPRAQSPDAFDTLDAKRRWLAVRQAIDALPPNQRTVLLLARFEGLSYREIAEVMNISVSAVESRLFRAMRRLGAVQATLDANHPPKDSP